MTATRIVTVPTVRPVLEVAVGDVDQAVGQAVYDTARYDQWPAATYAGLDAEWTDAGCDVVEAVTYCGRQRAVDAFDIGTATLRVHNPDGLWDYPPTSSLTPLSLRPGRMGRVGVIVDDAPPVWLFTGWIDSTAPVYDAADPADFVDVTMVDAKGQVGRTEVGRVAAVGAGETVTARMGRYADLAGFPAHRRQFDASGVTLAATTLGGRLGALLDRSAQSAAGDIFGDEYGNLVYRNADWQTNAGSQSDAVIGNRGLPGEVCPNAWQVAFRRSDFTTRVNYGRTGEDARTVDDLPNQTRFGVETYTATSLETVDTATLDQVAARILRVRNFDRAPWIAGCELDAARPGVVDLLTAASPFLPSVYQVGHVARDGRTVFARQAMLTGVEHTINGDRWTARLMLDDAAPFIAPSDARYDTARYDADRYSRAV